MLFAAVLFSFLVVGAQASSEPECLADFLDMRMSVTVPIDVRSMLLTSGEWTNDCGSTFVFENIVDTVCYGDYDAFIIVDEARQNYGRLTVVDAPGCSTGSFQSNPFGGPGIRVYHESDTLEVVMKRGGGSSAPTTSFTLSWEPDTDTNQTNPPYNARFPRTTDLRRGDTEVEIEYSEVIRDSDNRLRRCTYKSQKVIEKCDSADYRNGISHKVGFCHKDSSFISGVDWTSITFTPGSNNAGWGCRVPSGPSNCQQLHDEIAVLYANPGYVWGYEALNRAIRTLPSGALNGCTISFTEGGDGTAWIGFG